jgi:dipeptidyl aminopeptidase/acylaminoacyl peptidase
MEAAGMSKTVNRKQANPKRPKTKLGLPDLDHSRSAVLDSLRSPESKRGYRHAIDEFISGTAPNRDCPSTRLSSPDTEFTLRTGAQSVLFTGHKITTNYDEANLEVLSLKTGKWKVVQQGGYSGRYVPTGHLVYVSRSTLHAVPFDLNALEVRGKPVPLPEDVAGNSGTAAGRFETHNGMLVYHSDRQVSTSWPVMWVDAAGTLETIPLEPGRYHSLRLSPDGAKLAVEVDRDRRDADIVIYDFPGYTGS